MTHCVEVAIVGSGPYGLSLAAHLHAAGIAFRVFGKPMTTWRNHMPKGMCLKSDGFASNLSAPDAKSTLEAWSAVNGKDYSAKQIPVNVDDFVAYSGWFARTYVPMLEEQNVTHIVRAPHGYTLTLEDGETVQARRVVMAVGITWFKNLPPELAALPQGVVSHSFDHTDCSEFAGRDVTIIGGGSSAIDTAITLREAGAKVRIVARRKSIDYHAAPDNEEPTLIGQIANPGTGIGPGWRSFFCTQMPLVFHRLPQKLRLDITRRHLGPAPGWFAREKIEGKVPMHLSHTLKSAHLVDGRVAIDVKDAEGRDRILMADHVIAATGYKPDLARLPFLDAGLRQSIEQVAGTPVLNDNFESSQDGLYFLGLMAANSFGPLLRFMYGAEFAAPRLAGHLHRRVAAAFGRKKAA